MKHPLRLVASKLMKRILRMLGTPDYAHELAFWESYLAKRPAALADPDERRRAFPQQLISYIDILKMERGDRIRLLEVGSGPVSLLTWGVDQKLFELTAIDPLAEAYEKLMKKYRLYHPVKPIVGHGEKLRRLFDDACFDIAYSSNALDHTKSPRACLHAISHVVRKGGIVYLEGFVKEGSNENWQGLHQHDLVPDGGHLLHYDKRGRATDLTKNYRLRCVYEDTRPFHERQISSFGYEWCHGGIIEPWYYWDWYTMIFEVMG